MKKDTKEDLYTPFLDLKICEIAYLNFETTVGRLAELISVPGF
jgi:hypothetical protein